MCSSKNSLKETNRKTLLKKTSICSLKKQFIIDLSMRSFFKKTDFNKKYFKKY